ncbi:hypothetical protein CONLIGDRAFT_213519 [Coniochaeta ligniaria NRRL 30616]|uniref:Uncharacterized protein n=1 Tax=Coniochaeta ligniaria NRRL 30616 TaxID=1408157 RepID=A0A1J7JLD0_9PEZI|nr:hypothetical protein CONLIGDRAFT_213519 [Coniochaeta ligniaria NRRL 30616]
MAALILSVDSATMDSTPIQTADFSVPAINGSHSRSANGYRSSAESHTQPSNMASNGSDKPTNGTNGNTSNAAPTRNEPRPGDYVQWQSLPPGGPLNRWSHTITREHDFPGAQVSSSFPSRQPFISSLSELGPSNRFRLPRNQGERQKCCFGHNSAWRSSLRSW